MEKTCPLISEYVSVDDFPEVFNFIKGGISEILHKVYFKQIQISKSSNFSAIQYYTILRSYKKLEFEIPGTGLNIILNPSHLAPVYPGAGVWRWYEAEALCAVATSARGLLDPRYETLLFKCPTPTPWQG